MLRTAEVGARPSAVWVSGGVEFWKGGVEPPHSIERRKRLEGAVRVSGRRAGGRAKRVRQSEVERERVGRAAWMREARPMRCMAQMVYQLKSISCHSMPWRAETGWA
jgi:hypothetical protein